MWNAMQPPHNNENAKTHISSPASGFDPYLPNNMIVQLRLYHWCRTEFVNGVAIADLHHHLFGRDKDISKRHMGLIMRETTKYDCRKLKGVTRNNPKACVTYIWEDPDDLRFGLEWMMSMWAYCLDGISLADIQQEPKETWHETTSAVFSNLSRVDGDTLYGDYIRPIKEDYVFPQYEQKIFASKPSWPSLWAKHQWTEEQTAPTEYVERPLVSRL